MRHKSIYICGPMRGIRWHNFPAFDTAWAMLLNKGWDVISPADLNREEGHDSFDLPLCHDWNHEPLGLDLEKAILRDLAAVAKCDAIYVLRGRSGHLGCNVELALAKFLKKEIIYEDPQEVVEPVML